MLLRTRLTYDYYEIFHYVFCCRWLFKKKHSGKTITDRRHALYRIGHEKLEKELDVINIIKNLRQLRLMTNFLLTKEQRTLLKFQRRNVIDTKAIASQKRPTIGYIIILRLGPLQLRYYKAPEQQE